MLCDENECHDVSCEVGDARACNSKEVWGCVGVGVRVGVGVGEGVGVGVGVGESVGVGVGVGVVVGVCVGVCECVCVYVGRVFGSGFWCGSWCLCKVGDAGVCVSEAGLARHARTSEDLTRSQVNSAS